MESQDMRILLVGFSIFLFSACSGIPGAFPRGGREVERDPDVPASPGDSLRGVGRAGQLLRHRYGMAGRSASERGGRREGTVDPICDGSDGVVCHGGDPDMGVCNANVPCHPSPEWFLDGLREEALTYPQSGFLIGQAVYALTKFGRLTQAQEVVDACEAEEWWCEALQGYVLYAHAPLVLVEGSFRSALARAPEEIRCRWEDALWLLGEWDQRSGGVERLPPGREATLSWSCPRRLAVSDTLWWLSDPLLSREGNDRWTTHMARAMAAHLSEELRRTMRGRERRVEEQDYHWAMIIRRGQWDSYERLPPRGRIREWTSLGAARYHFIPEASPDDVSRPVWDLQGDILKEGYTPEYGPLYLIPAQVARFRRGDSLQVVAAAGLDLSRLRRALEATSYLHLSAGPDDPPLRLQADTRRQTPVLVGMAPQGRYLAAVEVFTDLGIGLNRQLVEGLEEEGAEVSDLLLFDSEGEAGGDGLREVMEDMLGSTQYEEGGNLGVFFEVYGSGEGEALAFELALERRGEGLVDRLVGLFPGGSREGRGRVTWTEPSTGEAHPRSISLDLSALRAGGYEMVLQVSWTGQPPLVRRRPFRIR